MTELLDTTLPLEASTNLHMELNAGMWLSLLPCPPTNHIPDSQICRKFHRPEDVMQAEKQHEENEAASEAAEEKALQAEAQTWAAELKVKQRQHVIQESSELKALKQLINVWMLPVQHAGHNALT